MAGTVVADTLQAASASTLVLKNGVASTPPAVQDSAGTEIGTFCRAWVNFNGTGTVAIRADFNVTSITDNGVGDYTVNFTTAMPDANYSTVGFSSTKSGVEGIGLMAIEWTTVPATTAVRIATIARGTGSGNDNTYNNVAIFR